MLIDLHAHSSGISSCCKASGLDALIAARSVGLDGLCLTNHYYKAYLEKRNETAAEFAESYIAEYEAVKALGKQMGLRVFFGIEVTMARHNNIHMLVYGVDEEFVCRYPTMFDCTQAELYKVAHENGGLLVQAHPVRRGKNVLLDPAYLDGVEINSHPLYDSTHYEELATYANDHGLFLTSGGDYHADTHRPKCGVYLPDDLADTRAIMAYLQGAKRIELCLQEPYDTESQTKAFEKR